MPQPDPDPVSTSSGEEVSFTPPPPPPSLERARNDLHEAEVLAQELQRGLRAADDEVTRLRRRVAELGSARGDD